MNGSDRATHFTRLMHDDEAALAEGTHVYLRRVTRPWHDRVEAAFERFDLRTRAGLSAFLLRQARAVGPIEHAIERTDIGALLPDWPLHRRAPALQADLAHLGLLALDALPLPLLPSVEHTLGALYVLEGSKLGGRVLSRQVQASEDPAVRAAGAFLSHRLERGWPVFLAVLQGRAMDTAARERLKAGADLAFGMFDAAAHQGASHEAKKG